MNNYFKRLLFVLLLFPLLLLYSADPMRAEEAEEPVVTLADQVIVSGEAAANSQILCSVYAFPDGREQVLLYQTRVQTGASGFYNLSVPLPYIGVQYVALDFETERVLRSYERYPASLITELTDMELNLYDYLVGHGMLNDPGMVQDPGIVQDPLHAR